MLTRKLKMAILHGKQWLLRDNYGSVKIYFGNNPLDHEEGWSLDKNCQISLSLLFTEHGSIIQNRSFK